MVHVIETKHLSGLPGNLVITQDTGVVQTIIGETTLKEWIVPLIHKSLDIPEVSVKLDSNIINNHVVLMIDSTHIHTGSVSYPYTQGDVMLWDTRLPQLIAILRIPQLDDTVGGLCEMWTRDGQLHIRLHGSVTYHFQLLYGFDDCDSVYVDGSIIREIFNNHTGELCKLYMESDFPICLELNSPSELKTRYYVAPCDPP